MQKKWAELGGYTCNAAILKSDAFRKATPYNEAFYQSMFMVKDFWAVPEYAELLTAANKRWHPFVVGGKGTAAGSDERSREGLGGDVQEVRHASKLGRTDGALGPRRCPLSISCAADASSAPRATAATARVAVNRWQLHGHRNPIRSQRPGNGLVAA